MAIVMPIKRPQFINGEIYHLIIRGIAARKTFLEKKDYIRYIYCLYKFNDKTPAFNISRDSDIVREAISNNLPPKPEKPRDLLVNILAICLMPNHIHLLIRQVSNNGISLFFQKMGGYSSYFNKKYQRFGSLFQRPFKAVHIKTNNQLIIVATYIHLNPTDLIEPGWKIKGISSPQKVMKFLESYPWSSYSHYLGKANFSWLIDPDFLNKIFKRPVDFQNFVRARIFYKSELKKFLDKSQKIFLD